MNKNSFDVALMPGVREALTESSVELRNAQLSTDMNLLDSGGLFLPGVAFSRDCPNCGSDKAKTHFVARGMHIMTCSICGLTYSRDVLSKSVDNSRYQGSEFMTRYHELKRTSIYSELEEKKASYIVKTVDEFTLNRGKMLDIGSSNGRLMLSALKQGWSTRGIEANTDLVADCLAQQLHVMQGFFPDDMPLDWTEFDLITMLDVLEHVEGPMEFLERVQGFLKPNGLVVVQVPNFNSLIIRLEGAKNSNFCHGHWSYFEPATLDRVMQKAGFVKLFLETIISELDRILQFDEMQIIATIKEITGKELVSLEQLTVEYLHQNNLGYKVLAIYRAP